MQFPSLCYANMLCGAAEVLVPLEAEASRYMLVSGPCYACVRMNVLMLVAFECTPPHAH